MITKSCAYSFIAATMLGVGMAYAQSPVFTKLENRTNSGSLESVSDNGEWAVGYGKSPLDEMLYSYPRLVNVKTKESKFLFKPGEEDKIAEMMACDVTDDGSMVIGQYKGQPALWKASTEEWTILPVSTKGFTSGRGTQITPDGKYAIGTVTNPNWNETLVLWDLTGETPVDITPDNLPKPISLYGQPQKYEQIRSCDLSDDGSKFIGLVAFSYAGECWTFIYDMKSRSWEAIGYEVSENGKNYEFKATGDGYNFLEGGKFRPGTDIVAGPAYLSGDIESIYTYDPSDKKVVLVDGAEGKVFGSIDADGAIYASTPSGNPLRNWEVKVGKYWYDFKVVASQLWDVNWANDVAHDDYGYSGTFSATSDNGCVLISNDYSSTPYDVYLLEIPASLSELCPTVNLLDNYIVSPVNNSAFSILKEVRVVFDRNIDVVGDYNAVSLLDGEGQVVANSISLSADTGDSRVLTMAFRNRRLEVGENYTVVIPAGVVNMAGDSEKVNSEIRVNYKGRPAEPVNPVAVSPENGASVSRINASSNPVAFTFDAEIAPVENGGSIYLYSVDSESDKRERIAQLSGSINGNMLVVYPVMEQRLALGTTYEVVIEANTVSDISGSDPNVEYAVRYDGAYIPQQQGGSELFSADFNGGITSDKWMLYDGDGLEPADTPAQWGFVKEYPWWVARDDEGSTEMAAVSHSMYSPAGQSDDWMVSTQIYLPDNTGMLSFKSQSFRKNCVDKLKVYVYATDDIYTALTPTIIDRFRYSGDLIYDEVQSPGEVENLLAGDWRENTIKLDKYAGKNIYIAFVNDNRNQSAVFVDDVLVSRDLKFSLINLTPESILAKDQVEVKGILSIESMTDTYKGYAISLIDSEGNTVSTLADADEEMSKGWTKEFTFDAPLSTEIGKEVKYSIDVKVGDLTDLLSYSVKNLAIQTTKRVVVEEYTGQGCPNCPLGHVALDILEKDFGELILPLAIHTYTGDFFSTPEAVALTSFLGMNAAPTGRINRGPIVSPIDVSDKGDYAYKNCGVWYDYAVAELEDYAVADVDIISATFEDGKYNVNVEVKYALDMDNQNVNIFTVVTEDQLKGFQVNNRYSVADELLGEWGAGGLYGQPTVPYTFNDVVRTWAGTTCNGTGGYVPSSVKGGEAYTATIEIPNQSSIMDNNNTKVTVMLIDAESQRVINAARSDVAVAGVDGVDADRNGISVSVENGVIVVKSNESATATAYSVAGNVIATASGEGVFNVDAEGFNGVAIVVVKTSNRTESFKVVLK